MAYDFEHTSEELFGLLELVERAFEVEVDDAYLERIRAYASDPVKDLSPEAQKYAERGMHQLTSALVAYEKAEDPKLWRDYLDASYAELFLGVSPVATEPVESCYMNDERILYAKEYFQVKELMDKYGFAAPAGFLEPLDHIAMEWKFFITLLRAGKGAEAQQFKVAHMDTWMERACANIIDKDDVGFYTGIANLARAALIEMR